MGGTWSAMRTMMSEGLPREHHGLGFAGLSLSYRTGQIIGLPLGGFLAHPDKSIGGPFRSPFWADTYPFALPCVVGGGLALVAVVISQIYMHETLPNPWRPTICIRRQKTASNSCEGSDEVSVTPQRLTASMRDICTPTILNLLASNFLSVFFTELLFALYPLWAFSSRELGGLQLTPVQIGIHLSIRAFIHFALMLGFPAINRRWGTLTLYKRTTALWPVSIALLWLAGITAKRLDDSNAPIVWTILVIQFTLWSVTSFSWAALGILINDSTPFPAARSKLNAIMQITIVIPQALAPAAGTSLFALSIRTTFLNGYVVWLVLVLASMLHALHAAICLRRQPVSSETDA
ncbi:major facilitator superfamily domain-containing protein [Auriculariales sp. MPI-PUGE-AT-0066]|nr:major facilitator superfamily domain-containing protein [Auriculariales sp. MPI-PUGE-AT-0066]